MSYRPSMDSVLAHMAGVMAARGTCPTAKVGCVVSRDGRVISTGYNGSPAGMAHCSHRAGESPCRTAMHAEANAIAYAARYGAALAGATVHTTTSPCLDCARLLINAGIVRVVCGQAYRDLSGVDLLQLAGVEVTFDAR